MSKTKSLLIKIVVFSILINFAAAIMMYVSDDFTEADAGNLLIDNTNTTEHLIELSGSLKGNPTTDDTSSWFTSILDSLSYGIYSKLKWFLSSGLNGFSNMLRTIFLDMAGSEGEALGNTIFSTFNILTNILFIITIIYLFTSKDITGEY